MHLVSCYHCGCKLAAGAIAFIFPTDTYPAPGGPDQVCRCDEIVERWREDATDPAEARSLHRPCPRSHSPEVSHAGRCEPTA